MKVSDIGGESRMLPLPRERIERIEKLLDEHLGPAEVELTHDLFKDRSRGIRWGRVVELLLDELVEDGYMLLHEIPLRKRADIYKPDQSGDFQAVVTLPKPKNKHAEHLAVLEMTLKLLRVLSTTIKQRIADIPALDEDEMDLFQDILGEAAVADSDDGVLPTQDDVSDEPAEDLIDADGTFEDIPDMVSLARQLTAAADRALISPAKPEALNNKPSLNTGRVQNSPGSRRQKRELLPAMPVVRAPIRTLATDNDELEIPATLSRAKLNAAEAEDCAAGNHRRLFVLRKLRGDGGVTTTRKCKACGKILDVEEGFKVQANPATCHHRKARWHRPDQPGMIAVCVECGVQVKAKAYDWNGAGLEEPGDSPDNDEVIELCTES